MPESRPVALSAESSRSPRPAGSPTTVATAERPRPLGLSLTQIAGGALAAVTAAVLASFFGVAGTLTGAALGSVVSSIGAAVYSTSLSRAARAGRVLVVRPAGLDGHDPAAVPPPVATDPGVLAAATVAPEDLPAPSAPAVAEAGAADATAGASRWRQLVAHLRWKPIAVVAGLIFVAAMAVVNVSELAMGHPIGNSSTTGTTLTNLGGSSGTPATPTPTSTPASSGSSSPGASPTATTSATATATPSATAPGATGSPAPSPTSPAPTTATTPAPGTTGPTTVGSTTAPAPTTGAAATR